jgi:hypothetical protein
MVTPANKKKRAVGGRVALRTRAAQARLHNDKSTPHPLYLLPFASIMAAGDWISPAASTVTSTGDHPLGSPSLASVSLMSVSAHGWQTKAVVQTTPPRVLGPKQKMPAYINTSEVPSLHA